MEDETRTKGRIIRNENCWSCGGVYESANQACKWKYREKRGGPCEISLQRKQRRTPAKRAGLRCLCDWKPVREKNIKIPQQWVLSYHGPNSNRGTWDPCRLRLLDQKLREKTLYFGEKKSLALSTKVTMFLVGK